MGTFRIIEIRYPNKNTYPALTKKHVALACWWGGLGELQFKASSLLSLRVREEGPGPRANNTHMSMKHMKLWSSNNT